MNKLLRNGRCVFDEFVSEIKEDNNLAPELGELFAIITKVANGEQLPTFKSIFCGIMKKEKKKEKKPVVTFNYIKADNFHSVLATGVIGGITVNSLIDMNFYTDRVTIPQQLTMEVEKNGVVSKEIDRVSKNGLVREVQFGAIMDAKTAKSLVDWLNDKIKVIESESNK